MRRKTSLIIFILLSGLLIPIIGMTMSLPTQTIRLIIINPPDDLEVVRITPIAIDDVFQFQPISYHPEISSRLWETSYGFTVAVDRRLDVEWITFQFTSQEFEPFTMDLPLDDEWTTVLYLNLNTQTYSIRPFLWHNPLILLIWIVGLISVEAFFFLIFGNRSKRHWQVFMHNSILTQGLFIFYWFLITFMIFNGFFLSAIWFIFVFIFFGLRIYKLILELRVLPRLLPEISKRRTITYALLANLSSCAMAIFLVSNLFPPDVSFVSITIGLTVLIVIWRLMALKREALGWRKVISWKVRGGSSY